MKIRKDTLNKIYKLFSEEVVATYSASHIEQY